MFEIITLNFEVFNTYDKSLIINLKIYFNNEYSIIIEGYKTL